MTLLARLVPAGIALALVLLACTIGRADVARGSTTASTSTIQLRKLFRDEIQTLIDQTAIPVLLPPALPWSGVVPKLYLTGEATPHGWQISVSAAPDCRNATACFVASFDGKLRKRAPRPSNLRLPGGQPASYTPIRCGASCGPARIAFLHRGALITWRLKEPPRGGSQGLARLAAAGIAAGSG